VATFFLVPAPWYYALPIAFAVLFALAGVRGIVWTISDRKKFMIRYHLMGFIGVSLVLFGISFLYTSATENPCGGTRAS
jgi:hypothetical protein